MRFVVRIVLGAVIGIVALVAMWLLGVRWWIVGLASGLLAPITFLATFFIWTADRPEIGYEQVLFDMPNTVLSGFMIVLLVGVSFGVTHIHFGGGPAAAAISPAESAQVELIHIASDAQKQKGAADKGDIKTVNEFLKDARAKVAALANVTDKDPALKTATGHLVQGLDALGNCAAGDKSACLDAQVGLGGTLTELTKYQPPAAATAST